MIQEGNFIKADLLVPGYMYTYGDRDEAVAHIVKSSRSSGVPDEGIRSILRGRRDMTEAEIDSALEV